jgi:Ca2+-binding RTX toxin-like protein
MAITPIFLPGARTLLGITDQQDTSIEISRTTSGDLLVNKGAVAILGGSPTVVNTTSIAVFGRNGADRITLNETNGPLPGASLFGGRGNDTLTGGSGRDLLLGEAGDDVIDGGAGSDLLLGGAGDDVLAGGAGDDQVLGGAGQDRMLWNRGDGSDTLEGGAGTDTAVVQGSDGAEAFIAAANGARIRVDRSDPAPSTLDIGTTEALVVSMGGGADRFAATGNIAALAVLTVDGGAGDDTIAGGNGNDLLLGGEGQDLVDGNQGNDVARLGAGDDTFAWDPGDGSDTVLGEAGTDTLVFNGSGGSETMSVAAGGPGAQVLRDIGAIVMDLGSVEQVAIAALGGRDAITVGGLAGTGVQAVRIDLAGTPLGNGGDGEADSVIVTGGDTADTVEVTGGGGGATVLGLAATVAVLNAEGAVDALQVNTLSGDDRIDAGNLGAGTLRLTIDAGGGNDTVFGSQGLDVLMGGDGNDAVDGQQGDDLALLGAGDDRFTWDAGDGSDTIEGGAGADTLAFNGALVAETFTVAANGARARLQRDVAGVTMDLDDIETIDLQARDGADAITLGDLAGTDVTLLRIDLAGRLGDGDGAADSISANGTGTADSILVQGNDDGVTVSGLTARIDLAGMEEGVDRLTIAGQGGSDVIDATGLRAGAIDLVLQGGLGDDVLLGSAGDDLVVGGDGADLAMMGAGDDSFVWNPGDDSDIVVGEGGRDTLVFNGANIAEAISLSATGGRALLLRDIATVSMDLNTLEQVDIAALGGADRITLGDLAGTDVALVRVDLSGSGGAGDGAVDTVTLNAGAGDDVIVVTVEAGVVKVLGLAAEVEIRGFEATDRLVINGLGGDDVIDASRLVGGMVLTADGGAGDDVLIGSPGADVLLGGADDDVLLGGGGVDVLDGGTGSNIVIASAGAGAELFLA